MAQKKRGGRSEATRLADLVQQAVDDGADTAEEIHKAVADLPLEVLAKLDIFKESAKDVRRVQDASIGAIYDVVHRVNREVAKLARELAKGTARRKTAATRKTSRPATRRPTSSA
jgi:histone H3/H4